jgi:PEP-CTERM motif-containing protein
VEKDLQKIMNYIRLALIAAALCVFSGAAYADDIHVIFDPQIPQSGAFGIIESTGVDYTADWEDCGTLGIPQSLSGHQACLGFINETGGAISELNFSFVVNSALVGQTIACDNQTGDNHLSSNDCSSVPGPFSLGQLVQVSFFSGDPIPNQFAFFIAEDGVALTNAPPVGVEAPEPSSLGMLASGMGLLGLALVLVKR